MGGDVLLSDIVDSQGNKRFIEGNLGTEAISGVTFTYAKWSLSGTHLMLVLMGNIASGTSLANNVVWASWQYPQWIKDKIRTITGSNVIEFKGTTVREIGGSGTTVNTFYANKGGALTLYRTGATTAFTYDACFSIQFDMLIDSE